MHSQLRLFNGRGPAKASSFYSGRGGKNSIIILACVMSHGPPAGECRSDPAAPSRCHSSFCPVSPQCSSAAAAASAAASKAAAGDRRLFLTPSSRGHLCARVCISYRRALHSDCSHTHARRSPSPQGRWYFWDGHRASAFLFPVRGVRASRHVHTPRRWRGRGRACLGWFSVRSG